MSLASVIIIGHCLYLNLSRAVVRHSSRRSRDFHVDTFMDTYIYIYIGVWPYTYVLEVHVILNLYEKDAYSNLFSLIPVRRRARLRQGHEERRY